jgi:hypothetical protein
VKLVSLVHYLEDSKLMVTMNVRYKYNSCLQKHLVDSLNVASEVIENLAVTSFCAVHQNTSTLREHIDCRRSSVLRRLHTLRAQKQNLRFIHAYPVLRGLLCKVRELLQLRRLIDYLSILGLNFISQNLFFVVSGLKVYWGVNFLAFNWKEVVGKTVETPLHL